MILHFGGVIMTNDTLCLYTYCMHVCMCVYCMYVCIVCVYVLCVCHSVMADSF